MEIGMYTDKIDEQYPRQPGKIQNLADARRHIDGYDCGIKYMDNHIGTLLNALDAKGVLEDLIIIVSADHGENHGELGLWAEHGTADNITCRLPMIIRWPEQQQGQVDKGLHYNIDLAPTLAEMLNKEARASWDGTKLR